MPIPKPSVRDAISHHLRAHGPCSEVELYEALVDEGVTTARTPAGVRTSLGGITAAFQLPDGRWDLTTRLLSGVVLTIRPRSQLRDDVLWVHDDLAPFDGLLTGDAIPLINGATARLGGGRIRTLIGPSGWLPALPAGGLLGLRWTGHALDVFAVDQPIATDPESLAPIRSVLRQHAESLAKPYGAQPSLASVLVSALREVPELFATPLPPISELYPLPERELDDTSIWEAHRDGRRLTLHLPHRVYDELERRASLLGEHLADHATVLLGAASDRVQLTSRSSYDYAPYAPYPERDEPLGSLRSVP